MSDLAQTAKTASVAKWQRTRLESSVAGLQDFQLRQPTSFLGQAIFVCVQVTKYGHLDHANLLIKYGADLHTQNNAGNTPLHVAASHGQVRVCMLHIQQVSVGSLNTVHVPQSNNNRGNFISIRFC